MVRPAPAVEDYLKAIYAHTEWQARPMTSSQLAARLGLAPSTVTEMVRKLSGQGLVAHEPYGAVELTAEGRREALRMVRRHRLLETWLVREFGYRWDEVHEEAEVLEHAVSDRLLDALDARLGRPAADPHGDPIPSADGAVRLPDAVVLGEVPDGTAGRVARISDRDPGILRELEERGVGIGNPVTARELPPELEDAIWIEVAPPQ
ncbi:MAG: metal-dependent transcriptional regulator [Naasia sp.]|nr:metal-dependent transcriptional regulator [Naasia sp.]